MKKALIIGISGQDGSYLAQFLLKKGYKVFGTTRDDKESNLQNLARLQIREQVEIFQLDLLNLASLASLFNQIDPDEVYNLAGQSSVAVSFEKPKETLESIVTATINILEAIKNTNKNIKLFSAGSSECFGDTNGIACKETTPFKPGNPYGIAKACAFWEVDCYRKAHKLFACTGILFNHESPLRTEKFVTQKIIRGACEIAAGRKNTLQLGNLLIERDWGWAPDFVEAMWLMLQQEEPEDFVIATGKSYSLQELIDTAFTSVNLNWRDFVESDSSMLRPTDVKIFKADPSKALKRLNWKAKKFMPEIVQEMVQSYMKQLI